MKGLLGKPSFRLIIILTLLLLGGIFLIWQLLRPLKQGLLTQVQTQLSNKIQPQERLEAVSLIPNYQLKITDKQKLDNFLNEIGFWQENGVATYLTNPSRRVSVKALRIELVPEVADPWWRQVTKDGEVVAAIDTEVSDEGIAQISFSIWKKDFTDQKRLTQRMDSLFRLGMYGLVPTLREKTEQEKKMSGVIKYLGREYGHYSNLLTISARH